MKKQTNSTRSPKGQEKKKFTADMIGMPESDFRHIGHVGYNGVTFGDISCIGREKDVENILPIKGGSSGNTELLTYHLAILYQSKGSYVVYWRI